MPRQAPLVAQQERAATSLPTVRRTASSRLDTAGLFPAAAPDRALPESTAGAAEPFDFDWRRERQIENTEAARMLAELPPLRWDIARTPQAVTRIAFPQWSSVMAKNWGWDAAFYKACDHQVGRSCQLRDWQAFLERLEGTPPETQLAEVNREINRVSYREDIRNWGDLDYWASPGEFFANGGDCEDYAIAKYYSLRALGFTAEQMRIVVLQDLTRHLSHAVLVVAHGGAELVLDNLSDRILPWQALPAYQPYYSVNELAYWLHGAGDPT